MCYRATALCIVVGILAAFASGAGMGEPPTGDAPLSGPSVTTPAKKATIVERDVAGKVKRLDATPAEAAVRAMKLDKETRAKVDEIFAKQAAALDAIVSENLKLIVQVSQAKDSGKHDEQRAALAELMEVAKPLRDRGMLGQQLAGVLSAEETRQMRTMVQGYFEAVQKDLEDAPAMAPDAAKPDGAAGKSDKKRGPDRGGSAMRGEILQIAGNEIRRAYERVVTQRSREFDETLKTLGLTPEQESKVRKIVGDSFVAKYGKASPAEQARVFREVYLTLDESQRAQLAKMLRPAPEKPTRDATPDAAPTKR